MDAYMICDMGNPLSVAYSKVSLGTWEDVKSVDIQRLQCFTPATYESAPYFKDLTWTDTMRRPWKVNSKVRYFTPSEKACFMTMFNLWVKQSESSDRFLMLEHDAYVRDPGKLNALLERIHSYDVWLPGIALETVSMSQRFAMDFVDSLQSGRKLDLGPMGLMQEFFEKYYKKPNKRNLWPTSRPATDSSGNIDHSKPRIKNLSSTLEDGVITGLQKAPVTQCMYLKGHKEVDQLNVKHTYDAGCSTIEHTTAVSVIDNMEILDSLPLDN